MVKIQENIYIELEEAIGYKFQKKALLIAALTHRSYRFENDDISFDNQRLEFLGDAVLGFISAAYLYDMFKDSDEGKLTSFRSQITSGKALAKLARDINLGVYIKVGKGEQLSGGQDRTSNLEDAMESVIGAAYIDGGIKAVRKIFDNLFISILNNIEGDVWADNPKGCLQEYSQRKWKNSPKYKVLKKEGLPHNTIFTVEVFINDKLYGTGVGRSKREAESQAAIKVLKQFEEYSTN